MTDRLTTSVSDALVERVARALCEFDGDDWNREGPGGLDGYRHMARAAIAAIPPAAPSDALVEREVALCKEAVDHCMNGSGLQLIDNETWHQFAKARLKLATIPTEGRVEEAAELARVGREHLLAGNIDDALTAFARIRTALQGDTPQGDTHGE